MLHVFNLLEKEEEAEEGKKLKDIFLKVQTAQMQEIMFQRMAIVFPKPSRAQFQGTMIQPFPFIFFQPNLCETDIIKLIKLKGHFFHHSL